MRHVRGPKTTQSCIYYDCDMILSRNTWNSVVQFQKIDAQNEVDFQLFGNIFFSLLAKLLSFQVISVGDNVFFSVLPPTRTLYSNVLVYVQSALVLAVYLHSSCTSFITSFLDWLSTVASPSNS